MAIVLMLGWWYSKGWLWIVKATEIRLHTVSQVFAVKTLLRTWFAPWKQIHTDSTLSNYLSNLVDNIVSRSIGAFVRGFILLWALLLSASILALGLVSALLWPLVPLLVIILPVLALTGVNV